MSFTNNQTGLPWLWAEYTVGSLTCAVQYTDCENNHLLEQDRNCKWHTVKSVSHPCVSVHLRHSDFCLISLLTVLNWNGERNIWTVNSSILNENNHILEHDHNCKWHTVKSVSHPYVSVHQRHSGFCFISLLTVLNWNGERNIWTVNSSILNFCDNHIVTWWLKELLSKK
jgi:hypothetical protein